MTRILLIILLTISSGLLSAQQPQKTVFTFAIDQDIDTIMNRRVKLAMDQAE